MEKQIETNAVAVALAAVGVHRSVPFSVDAVVSKGRAIRIYVTFRYLAQSPVCCGELGCYVNFLGNRRTEVPNAIRKAIRRRRIPSVVVIANCVYEAGCRHSQLDFGPKQDHVVVYDESHFE